MPLADAPAWLRVHEFDDHLDDVSRREELTVRAGHLDLAKQVFIHVAFKIVAVVRGQVHIMNGLNDGAERRAVIDF